MSNDLKRLTDEVKAFRDARNWSQFHDGRNLATSLSVESAELLELFLWNRDADVSRIEEELADVFYSALLLAEHYKLDVFKIVSRKLRQNEKKYPVDKAAGRNDKYDRL